MPVAQERRFLTAYREEDRAEAGLVIEDDGIVWWVAASGARTQLGVGGGGGGGGNWWETTATGAVTISPSDGGDALVLPNAGSSNLGSLVIGDVLDVDPVSYFSPAYMFHEVGGVARLGFQADETFTNFRLRAVGGQGPSFVNLSNDASASILQVSPTGAVTISPSDNTLDALAAIVAPADFDDESTGDAAFLYMESEGTRMHEWDAYGNYALRVPTGFNSGIGMNGVDGGSINLIVGSPNYATFDVSEVTIPDALSIQRSAALTSGVVQIGQYGGDFTGSVALKVTGYSGGENILGVVEGVGFADVLTVSPTGAVTISPSADIDGSDYSLLLNDPRPAADGYTIFGVQSAGEDVVYIDGQGSLVLIQSGSGGAGLRMMNGDIVYQVAQTGAVTISPSDAVAGDYTDVLVTKNANGANLMILDSSGELTINHRDAGAVTSISNTSGGPVFMVGEDTIGFFGATQVPRPTGVAVTAGGIHAALVTLGLIAA